MDTQHNNTTAKKERKARQAKKEKDNEKEKEIQPVPANVPPVIEPPVVEKKERKPRVSKKGLAVALAKKRATDVACKGSADESNTRRTKVPGSNVNLADVIKHMIDNDVKDLPEKEKNQIEALVRETIANKDKVIKSTKKIEDNKITMPDDLITTMNGWTVLKLVGPAYLRGYIHGSYLKSDIIKMRKAFVKIVEKDFHVSMDEYLETIISWGIPDQCKEHFKELHEEIVGIATGCEGAMTYTELIGWNHLLGMYNYYSVSVEKCNAVIAFNPDGELVMAHSTHSEYITGMVQPYIFYYVPTHGNSFVMQSLPGYIFSGSDFFMNSAGIMGCETSMAMFKKRPEAGLPLFCRARVMMQYGTSLDECMKLLMHKNAGDYPCIWLIGDNNKKMLLKLELGADMAGIYTCKKGFVCSANIPECSRIIVEETELNEKGGIPAIERFTILHTLMTQWDGSDTGLKNIFRHVGLCDQEKKRGDGGGSSDFKFAKSSGLSDLSFIANWGSPCKKKMVIKG